MQERLLKVASLLLRAFQALCHSEGISMAAAKGNMGLEGAD